MITYVAIKIPRSILGPKSSRSLLDCAILLVWCGFLFGYGIEVGTLYRTEALRAIIGREALNGSWLVPTLYGEPFLSKPPGMYAAIAAASAPFGAVTAVSARLPSALAATATVFFFFVTFRRIFEPRFALAGAMLMPVSFLWLERAPSAEIDIVQLLWVSAALLCFLRALEMEESFAEPGAMATALSGHALGENTPTQSRGHGTPNWPNRSIKCVQHQSVTAWWLLALLCVTAGFLTKWTAPAFFYLTVIALLIWRRRIALLWSWRHLLAVSLAFGVCASWAWFVTRQVGWPRLYDTFVAELAQRFQPNHAGRSYPWFDSVAYPAQVLIANLPWSLLAVYACRPAFVRLWDDNGKRMLQLFHCWTWPNLLFWSLPAQHHVRYCLPMCPGIVGLGVMVAISWARTMRANLVSRDAKSSERSAPLREAEKERSLQIANCKLQIANCEPKNEASKLCKKPGFNLQFAICNLQFAIFKLYCLLRNPSPVFIAILLLWSLVKVSYIEFILPPRTAQRHVRETAAQLAALIPAGETLYVCRLKDEGVLFYYNRPARRFQFDRLPDVPFHAALIEAEWRALGDARKFELLERLTDQQGDSIVVVRRQ